MEHFSASALATRSDSGNPSPRGKSVEVVRDECIFSLVLGKCLRCDVRSCCSALVAVVSSYHHRSTSGEPHGNATAFKANSRAEGEQRFRHFAAGESRGLPTTFEVAAHRRRSKRCLLFLGVCSLGMRRAISELRTQAETEVVRGSAVRSRGWQLSLHIMYYG